MSESAGTNMKTWARVQDSAVAELLTTDADPATLFHPALHWVDVTGQNVAVGWLVQGNGFAAPPAPSASLEAPVPDITALQAQITALAAQVAALVSHS
jgi:hypothetical protein